MHALEYRRVEVPRVKRYRGHGDVGDGMARWQWTRHLAGKIVAPVDVVVALRIIVAVPLTFLVQHPERTTLGVGFPRGRDQRARRRVVIERRTGNSGFGKIYN